MRSWKIAVMGIETLLATYYVSSFLAQHSKFLDDWGIAAFILILVAFISVKLSIYEDAQQVIYDKNNKERELQDKILQRYPLSEYPDDSPKIKSRYDLNQFFSKHADDWMRP